MIEVKSKKYTYKGKLYSDDPKDQELPNWGGYVYRLLNLLGDEGHIDIVPVVYYVYGGESIGTDNDMDEEDVIDYLIDCGVNDLEDVGEWTRTY